jgi:isochorismate hydrolase
MMQDYLTAVEEYNVRVAKPDPVRCALLIVDMQEYFRPVALSVADNVSHVLSVCRSRSIPVFYTRHGHRDISVDGGMLYEWWGQSVTYGTWEWRIIPEVAPQEGDAVLDKRRYSAFRGTGLDGMLRELGVEELIVTGVLTNCCCENTAREAFDLDYRVFFASDATATANEELHLSTLRNLAFGFAYVQSASQLAKAI